MTSKARGIGVLGRWPGFYRVGTLWGMEACTVPNFFISLIKIQSINQKLLLPSLLKRLHASVKLDFVVSE